MAEKIKGPLDREDDFNGGPVNPRWTSPESAREIKRLHECIEAHKATIERRDLMISATNARLAPALLKIERLKVVLRNLVKYAEGSDAYMTADEHPLEAARAALSKEAPNEDPI